MRIAFNPLEEVFEVTSAAIERDRSFIPDISKLWRDGTSLFDMVDEYLHGLRLAREVSESEVKTIQSSIARLHGLLSFPFTALQLLADISDEDVADVFVRINSKGESLDQADFILTIMSVFWDGGRKNLERFCRESRKPSTNGVSPFNYFIEPHPDQLLRVCVGLAFKRARLRHVYSILRGKDLETGEFSEERRVEQFEKLKHAQAKVLNLQYWHDFMQCVRQAGYRTGGMINSRNALLYTYTFYLIGRTELRIKERELRAVIAQWLFMSLVTGRYTGSPESTMESDLAMLRDAKTAKHFVTKLKNTCNVSLTDDFWSVTLPNELATPSARSPSLFAFQAALVLTDAPVLFSKFKVAEMLDPALGGSHNAIEKHHLFPKGYLATIGIEENRDINQIANYAFVEWRDNVDISDQSPAEYLPQLEQSFGSESIAQMYNANALPKKWENMDYWTFLERRRELMAQIILEGYRKLTAEDETGDESLEVNLRELIEAGESDVTEFKSTLRVNLHTRKPDKRMEISVLKTLAGFLNTEGGTLIVGVSDDGMPLGLDVDNFSDEDKMSLHLVNIVNDRISPNAWTTMHANFDDYEDGRVLVVHCQKSRNPVYLSDGNEEQFYVRTGPSTVQLSMSQTQEYIKQRFD